jgi:serine/threonine-protein kinase
MERLQRAIALITDGQQVDWEGLMEDARDPAERRLIAELRGLAQLDADRPAGGELRANESFGVPAPRQTSQARRWGYLELLDELGSGAYGVVYRAWDTRLAREVALKLLRDTGAGPSLEEARRLARVSHPNVVTVYGADRIDGQVGLWMELLKGRTLDQILAADGPFSAREAIGIGVEICGAVAAIHAVGLIHRDIKAQNVVREPGGRLVLMDMGASVSLAQHDAAVESLAGTPLYMAPELLEGAAPSRASDVYAVGVLLYRLVTAEFPVHAATIGALRQALAGAPLRSLRDARPTLPAGLITVIDTCMSRTPSDRYATLGDLERALLAVDRPALPGRANRWSALLAITLAAIIGGALAWTIAVTRPVRSSSALADTSISPERYKLYSGYEELAFAKHEEDPRSAIAATTAAIGLIRSPLPGNHPVYAVMYARLAELWRRVGDSRQATEAARDAATHMLESVGDDHPLAAIVAMERARNAQASHEFRRAAEELQRALVIRSRLLGLPATSAITSSIDIASLDRAVRTASLTDDADGDGVLDALALVRERSGEHDRAGDPETERLVTGTDRLLLGWRGSPFLSWAQNGVLNPRSSGWQAASNFPLGEAPRLHAWSIVAPHSLGFFHQRLAPAHSARAMQHGFSALLRGAPVRGLITFSLDLAPAGPRFDLLVRRVDARSVEVRLPSSIVPREGPTVSIDAPVDARWPVLELRYDPRSQQAALYCDGHLVTGGYPGHRQFQNPAEGTVSWGVAALGDGDTGAEAAFGLVWLEIF